MIIDTHTHFGDPARPKPLLFRTQLPETYKAVAVPEGVTGTVVTESIADIEDNQWTLDEADRDPFIVGLVGFLDPFSARFDADLARFAADPRFCGIRLHHNCCHQYVGDPRQSLDDIPERLLLSLSRLVEKDRALDLHGGCERFGYFEELNRRVDGLRIVINHIGECRPLDGRPPDPEWTEGIAMLAQSPNVYCKVSALVQMAADSVESGRAPADLEIYRPALDVLWNSFGANRLIYASNWPQIERVSDFPTAHSIVARYFAERGSEPEERFYHGNAEEVYNWNRK